MSKNHWPPIIPHTGWKTSSATHHPNTTILTTAPPGRYKRMAFLTTSSTTATTTIFSSSLYFAIRVEDSLAQLTVSSTYDMIVWGGEWVRTSIWNLLFFFFLFRLIVFYNNDFSFKVRKKRKKKARKKKHEQTSPRDWMPLRRRYALFCSSQQFAISDAPKRWPNSSVDTVSA